VGNGLHKATARDEKRESATAGASQTVEYFGGRDDVEGKRTSLPGNRYGRRIRRDLRGGKIKASIIYNLVSVGRMEIGKKGVGDPYRLDKRGENESSRVTGPWKSTDSCCPLQKVNDDKTSKKG